MNNDHTQRQGAGGIQEEFELRESKKSRVAYVAHAIRQDYENAKEGKS